MKKVAIVGGGSWGTALALALLRARTSHRISLWVHDPTLARQLAESRINDVYLPGHELPREIEITSDLAAALARAETVFGVMPSAYARGLYLQMRGHLASGAVIVSATKGLERETHLRMTEVIAQAMPGHTLTRVAVLSGPSFAREVARGDPTAVVVASADAGLARSLQEEFSGPTLRLYTNDDVTGVELGGAVKNVIAIAAGICVGLGFGANTVASLVTRGLAEMTRLAVALRARPQTLAGLAGLGDLVLTATGALSRNRSVGVALGQGRALKEIIASMRMVAEGVATTAATLALARLHGAEMPITEQMDAVLNRARAPRDAIRELMERRLKTE